MVAPDLKAHVEPYLVLAVRSPFVVAFPSDWPAGLVFESEMGVAALDAQNSGRELAGEQHILVEIGSDSFLA